MIVQSSLDAPANITFTIDMGNLLSMSPHFDGMLHISTTAIIFECSDPALNVNTLVGGYCATDDRIVIDSWAQDLEGKPLFPDFRLTLISKPTALEYEARIAALDWVCDQLIARAYRELPILGHVMKRFKMTTVEQKTMRAMRSARQLSHDTMALKHELQASLAKNERLLAEARKLLDQAPDAKSDRKLRQLAGRALRKLQPSI